MTKVKSKIKDRKYSRFVSLLLVLTILLTPTFASASAYDDINELEEKKSYYEQQAAEANKMANQKKKEADVLQQQVYSLEGQIAETESALYQTRIDVKNTQSRIDELNIQIKTKEEEIEVEKKKMHEVVASWYMEGDSTSIINSVLGSDSLSDLITTQEYYDSVKQQIELKKEELDKLKKELEEKKSEQDQAMIELKNKESEQENLYFVSKNRAETKEMLLDQASDAKTNYLNKASQLQQEIDQVSAEIYSLRQRADNNEYYVDGSSGYPYSAINAVDPWLFLTRQCTSYAAWYWNVRLGKSWDNTRPGSGSAYNWANLAYDQGYSVSSTPHVGAIISWGKTYAMPYGHVAIVESVNTNGTINISEYNWLQYAYSYRGNVTPSDWGSYSYIY